MCVGARQAPVRSSTRAGSCMLELRVHNRCHTTGGRRCCVSGYGGSARTDLKLSMSEALSHPSVPFICANETSASGLRQCPSLYACSADGATPPPLNQPDCMQPSFAHLYTSSEPTQRHSGRPTRTSPRNRPAARTHEEHGLSGLACLTVHHTPQYVRADPTHVHRFVVVTCAEATTGRPTPSRSKAAIPPSTPHAQPTRNQL
jgi:hypothetical protein